MRDNNLSSSNSAIQERKRRIYIYKVIIILVRANADTLYALNKTLAQKEKKVNLNVLTGNKNFEELFFFLLAIIMCLSMLHEVGHFLELLLELEMFYGGKENVFKVEATPLVSKGRHESANDKTWEENRTTEGWERRARWFCYSFIRKASAFSPKIIFLSTTLDCLSTTSCL